MFQKKLMIEDRGEMRVLNTKSTQGNQRGLFKLHGRKCQPNSKTKMLKPQNEICFKKI